MAREVQIWGRGRIGVPREYQETKPGNAFITRYIKEHSEIVYIQMARRGRTAHFRVVGYFAPARVVNDANLAWQRHADGRRRSAARVETVQRLGPAGDLTHDLFLRLEQSVLRSVFSEYKRTFGKKKYEYAKRKYEDWRAGTTEMSAELRQRLLLFLPRYLSLEQKYAIVEAIWRRSGTNGSHQFSIDSAAGVDRCLEVISELLRATLGQSIPDTVKAALDWLTDDDSRLAEDLARKLYEREIPIITSNLREKLEELLSCVHDHRGAATSQVQIELPVGHITIRLTGRHRMGGQGDNHGSLVPFDREKSPSRPTNTEETGGQLPAPIEHPQDLLGEALRRLPPEKTKEILSVAADKALALQIKQKESQIDNANLREKLDITIAAARRQRGWCWHWDGI